MLKNGEKIIIQSEWENKSKHMLAVSVAHQLLNGGDIKVKSYIVKIELEESDPLKEVKRSEKKCRCLTPTYQLIKLIKNGRRGKVSIPG